MKKEGVLVIGSANMDMVVTTERFPDPGETILGKKIGMYPGGKGANQAVSCAKLGLKTFFIGKMGNDIFKDRLNSSMMVDGVDNTHLLIDEKESTGIAFITVDKTGQNEIVVVSGSNMKLLPADIEAKGNVFKNVKVVLTQLEIPVETVLKSAQMAKQNGCTFILNPAPAAQLPEEIFPMIDFITPNESELRLLSGLEVNNDINNIKKAARELIDKGAKNVIVTLGEQGALWIDGKNEKLYPARKVKVVDSTAAGDSFNGALAYSLAMDNTIVDALHFAIAAASISVTRMGAQSSMPSLYEVHSVTNLTESSS